ATGGESHVASAPLILICTGTYWRNAWKYRSRTYRHFGWDNGTILANVLAMASALKFPAELVMGFVDSQVNSLLDLDTQKEAAFSLVTVGHTKAETKETRDIAPLQLPTVPYSREEVDYPAMRQIHEASSFASAEEVVAWRNTRLVLPRMA